MAKIFHSVVSIGSVLQFLNQVEAEKPEAEIQLELCDVPINPYEALGIRDLLEGYAHLNIKPRISMGCSVYSLVAASAFDIAEVKVSKNAPFIFITPTHGMFGSYTDIKIAEAEMEDLQSTCTGIISTFMSMSAEEVTVGFRDGVLLKPADWAGKGLSVLGEG